jgi:hypothetical protein
MVHYKGSYADQASALASGDADALSVRKGQSGPRCISRMSKPVDCWLITVRSLQQHKRTALVLAGDWRLVFG